MNGPDAGQYGPRVTRDLLPTPTPFAMRYVDSITSVLSDHLGWHRARLKFMARFTSALLRLTTTNLSKIALALKAGVQLESNYRRIQRFLSDYDMDFTMLARLLVHLVPERPPYVVALDRTEWHFGQTPVNVLMVGIAHRGICFPITWSVLPAGGSSGAGEQTKVLERFLAAVDPASIKAVVADREFISTEWLRRLQSYEVPFVVRLRSDRRIGHAPEGPALPGRMFARPLQLGEERILDGERHLSGTEGDQVATCVVVKRIAPASSETDSSETDDRFLILATWGIAPNAATTLYRRRWEIETLFGALKSRGFKLEKTHLTMPDRVERLMGLLALAFAWTHIVGEKRAFCQGRPPTKTHGRPERSLFRYGLDWLQSILTTPEPQRQAFFACLQGLRSPTSFLSCT